MKVSVPERCPVSSMMIKVGLVLLVAGLGLCAPPVAAQENADCLVCHEDPDLVGEFAGKERSVFVDPGAFAASVHAELACIDCHGDLDGVEDQAGNARFAAATARSTSASPLSGNCPYRFPVAGSTLSSQAPPAGSASSPST